MKSNRARLTSMDLFWKKHAIGEKLVCRTGFMLKAAAANAELKFRIWVQKQRVICLIDHLPFDWHNLWMARIMGEGYSRRTCF